MHFVLVHDSNVVVNAFVDLEMAIAYWNIVLHDRFKFLDLWSRYLVVSSYQCMLEFLLLFRLFLNDFLNFRISYMSIEYR